MRSKSPFKFTPPADAEFFTSTQLKTRYGGVSHMWLERRIANPDFPQPVKFGRLRFWLRSEVEAYEQRMAASRPQKAATAAA